MIYLLIQNSTDYNDQIPYKLLNDLINNSIMLLMRLIIESLIPSIIFKENITILSEFANNNQFSLLPFKPSEPYVSLRLKNFISNLSYKGWINTISFKKCSCPT